MTILKYDRVRFDRGDFSPLRKLWPHDAYDRTTWKYSGYKVGKDEDGNVVIREWVLNHEFRYKHLDETDSKNG